MRAVIRAGILGTTITYTDNHPPHPSLKANSNKESSKPTLPPTQVLIKVKSAAINPADYKLPRLIGGTIVGIDLSGTVEKIGKNVTSFKEGDEVFGRALVGKSTFTGSLAEWTVTSMDEIAKKPEWMSFEEAAAIPTAYLTGLQALRDAGKVKKGSTVLVIGASGGCGVAGVQLAKALGASQIVGICSGKNFDFVRDVGGSSELVDYSDADAMSKFVEDNKEKFDCIYDTVTGSGKGENYVSSPIAAVLKEKSGEFVQINGNASDWARCFMGKNHPHRSLVVTSPNSKTDLEEIAGLLRGSGLNPYYEAKSFEKSDIEEAFVQLKGRRTKGKIIFNIS